MTDYIIVGLGLSGIAISEEFLKLGKKIKVFENHSQSSSTVAGGIYNPIILKRFTLAWQANEQLELALPFYKSLEHKLKTQLVQELPIYRKFNSIEEQNNWFTAMDKPFISEFLDPNLVPSVNPNIPSDFSFGLVKKTGTVKTKLLLERYKVYLDNMDAYEAADFEYDQLQLDGNSCTYKGTQARRIIFCDGFGLTKNPYFNYLPLRGNKGEYLLIESKDLNLEVAIKSSIFILPLGNDLYKVGATYDNVDKSETPTPEAKDKLLSQFSKIITCEYKVVDQVAGIRPATADRKPLVGQHPKHKQLYCCNGFGSRGVLIAPTVAKQLISYIEKDTTLPIDIDISRYTKKFYSGSL
jgi:glycine/D-amino acid oxidase-like deaminating enzyme